MEYFLFFIIIMDHFGEGIDKEFKFILVGIIDLDPR